MPPVLLGGAQIGITKDSPFSRRNQQRIANAPYPVSYERGQSVIASEAKQSPALRIEIASG
jgi:hypothetical protein